MPPPYRLPPPPDWTTVCNLRLATGAAMEEKQARNWSFAKLGIAAAIVAVLVGGYFLINALVFGSSDGDKASVEENWNRTIGSLNVTPIFPPEEDLVVGDVLALVVQDNDQDPVMNRTSAALEQRSFVTRTVKLAHVDVVPDLIKAYSPLPIFPASGQPPFRKSVARDFEDGVLQANLPRAAFPKLRIQGIDNAAGGLAGAIGTASYGASNQQIAEFEVSDVKTYGLPSVRALELFEDYCSKDATKIVCSEATARKHLSRVVGDRIYTQTFDPKKGESVYDVKIEVVMVYRVYLTSEIRDLRRASRARSGFLRGWFGSSSDEPAQKGPEPVANAPSSAVNAEQIESLKKRLAEIEGQLAKLNKGGAMSYDSFSGNESSLEGKFDRPVAIAYRSVKFEFSKQEASPSTGQ